jgi:hypothetical protein
MYVNVQSVQKNPISVKNMQQAYTHHRDRIDRHRDINKKLLDTANAWLLVTMEEGAQRFGDTSRIPVGVFPTHDALISKVTGLAPPPGPNGKPRVYAYSPFIMGELSHNEWPFTVVSNST